ncbi:MAG: V-type ATP synthase subunit F [Chlamydiota bacterium]|nr:V-type ATP synthase subunit F [Chlamydiota bacterium]
MQPSKFCIITNPELATGFRLAGLTVFETLMPEQARDILYDLYQQGDYALIAMDEGLMPHKDKKLQKLMDEKTLPVIFPLQKPQKSEQIDQVAYVSELAKSCIGFYIKIT